MLPPWLLVTHNIPQKWEEVQRMQICYQRSNILLLVFFLNSFSFRQINIAILILKTPAQIVMTSVNSARPAFALNVFVPIGGFDDITTELALNCISYDFFHDVYLLLAQHNTTENRENPALF